MNKTHLKLAAIIFLIHAALILIIVSAVTNLPSFMFLEIFVFASIYLPIAIPHYFGIPVLIESTQLIPTPNIFGGLLSITCWYIFYWLSITIFSKVINKFHGK